MEKAPTDPSRLCAQSAGPGRESAAARRLRSFVNAAMAFDCTLSESDFQQFFRAVALSGEGSGMRSAGGGRWRPGGINPSSRAEDRAECATHPPDGELAAAPPHEALP